MARKAATTRKRKAGSAGTARAASEGDAPDGGPIPLEALRRIPAFAGMSPADASLFLAAMSLRPLTEHEPLFRAGQVGDGLFVILEGSVSLYRKNAKGGEREVAALERNEVLGEMDLISDRPHTTSAKGRTAGRVLFLPKGTFQDLLRRGNPGAASMVVYFARMLASRLDRNNQRMMELLDRGSEPRPPSEFAEFKRRLLKEWSF